MNYISHLPKVNAELESFLAQKTGAGPEQMDKAPASTAQHVHFPWGSTKTWNRLGSTKLSHQLVNI